MSKFAFLLVPYLVFSQSYFGFYTDYYSELRQTDHSNPFNAIYHDVNTFGFNYENHSNFFLIGIETSYGWKRKVYFNTRKNLNLIKSNISLAYSVDIFSNIKFNIGSSLSFVFYWLKTKSQLSIEESLHCLEITPFVRFQIALNDQLIIYTNAFYLLEPNTKIKLDFGEVRSELFKFTDHYFRFGFLVQL